MRMEGEEARRGAQVGQKTAGTTGVLGSHHANKPEDLGRARGEVPEIAQRRRDDVQRGAHPRCFLIRSSRVAFGTAPTTVSTWRPSRKKRMLGMERTLKRWVTPWFASTSNLATRSLPA